MSFSICAYAVHAPSMVRFILQEEGTNNCVVAIWDCLLHHLEVFLRLSSSFLTNCPHRAGLHIRYHGANILLIFVIGNMLLLQ